jgi:hypothetical protein
MKTPHARVLVLLPLCCMLAYATSAVAKDYAADRFDVTARLQTDRSLVVHESVVFRFDDEFTYVYREIPQQRTDGITGVAASMDGRRLRIGTNPGEVQLEIGKNVRVTWHFAKTTGVHTFDLEYQMRGVVERQPDADIVAWRVLPTRHAYRIVHASVLLELPAGSRIIGRSGIGQWEQGIEYSPTSVRTTAERLAPNASRTLELELARGTLSAAAPAWQSARDARARRGPWMLAVAVVILAAGFAWLVPLVTAWRRPSAHSAAAGEQTTPPDPLMPVAFAASLGTRRNTAAHALATLFDLAARGIVRFDEESGRGLVRRRFVVRLLAEPRGLLPHETTLLEMTFGSAPLATREMTASRLQRALALGARRFHRVLMDAMHRAGLVDAERLAVKARLVRAALVMLLAGLASIPLAVRLADDFGVWSALVPIAVVIVALATAAAAATFSLLSTQGARDALAWRRFFAYLTRVTRARTSQFVVPSAWLPWAVAAGVGHLWAKRFMAATDSRDVPAWFHAAAATPDQAHAAFVAFMSGNSGSGHGHAGHASAGASAAGGGSSGAG